jgi:hypothetical protein
VLAAPGTVEPDIEFEPILSHARLPHCVESAGKYSTTQTNRKEKKPAWLSTRFLPKLSTNARLSVFKGLQDLNRRRFKEIEDAPFAAYDLNQPGSKSPETFLTVRSLFT